MKNPRPPPLPPAEGARSSAAPAPAQPARTSTDTTRRIASQDLFGGTRIVEIEHHAQVYRLKQTALGKLILTK